MAPLAPKPGVIEQPPAPPGLVPVPPIAQSNASDESLPRPAPVPPPPPPPPLARSAPLSTVTVGDSSTSAPPEPPPAPEFPGQPLGDGRPPAPPTVMPALTLVTVSVPSAESWIAPP